jgi:hypothetical protein
VEILSYTFCKHLVEGAKCVALVFVLMLANETADDVAEDWAGEGDWRRARFSGVAWRVVKEGRRVPTGAQLGLWARWVESRGSTVRGVVARLLLPLLLPFARGTWRRRRLT